MELAFLYLSGVRVGVGGGASLCVRLQSTRLGLNGLVGAINYALVPNPVSASHHPEARGQGPPPVSA